MVGGRHTGLDGQRHRHPGENDRRLDLHAPDRGLSGRLPAKIGKYTPLIELATSRVATVYVARQAGLYGFERLVVVKRVHRHLLPDHELRSRLLDEANVTSLIRHTNVVSVTDVVESENEISLVMDYVESVSLAVLLAAHREAHEAVPPSIACRVIVDALAGLHTAHEATDARGNKVGIVHRDVSPQNVIVGIDGLSRVTDFGISTPAHRATAPRDRHSQGKLLHPAPGQLLGPPLDRRIDVFAAGLVLHEALTGRSLFQGPADPETFFDVLRGEIPNLSAMGRVPASLARVLQKALARNPADRFATTREFGDAIESTVALASPHDVGACVESKCRKLLESRRIELRDATELASGTLATMFDAGLSTTGMTAVVDTVGDAPSGGGQSRRLHRRSTLALIVGATTLFAGMLAGALVEQAGADGEKAEANFVQSAEVGEHTGTKVGPSPPSTTRRLLGMRGDGVRRRRCSRQH